MSNNTTPDRALLDAVAQFRDAHVDEGDIAIGALQQFAEELRTLRYACRSRYYRGGSTQCLYIAGRLEIAVPLDARLQGSRVATLIDTLERLSHRLSPMSRMVEKEDRALMRILELEARRLMRKHIRDIDVRKGADNLASAAE